MAEVKQERSGQADVLEKDVFTALVEKEFKPVGAGARDQIQRAVATLAQQALRESTVVSDDAISTIKAMIAEIDKRLSDQVNKILHSERFQQVESAWRGLHHLVSHTESDEMLKIRVMNVSKQDLAKTLKRYEGVAWDQSPLFKKLYEEEYGQFGGNPYGCLVGDYYFDHSPGDVKMLGQIAQIAAASHAPFIAAAAPSVMGMQSWQELANPNDIAKIFSTPEYAGWRSLRTSDDAKYIGLAMPRFLARLPYGARTSPVEEFEFEEETGGGDHSRYTWANAAYAMAVNINQAFKAFGWCTAIRGIESGGIVEGLPVHTFPSDEGGVDMKCPTEIAISDRREKECALAGFMPLLHEKNSDRAAFIGAQSLQKPQEYNTPDANSNARLAANLPYIFASSRFAHYLKQMVRAKIGASMERADLERYLSDWIKDYVLSNPANAGPEMRAKFPLSGAEVKVEEIPGKPGEHFATFHLRPHYQLEGVNVTMSMVSRLPSQRQG